MTFLREGEAEEPQAKEIEFKVVVDGQLLSGYARGEALPMNLFFDVYSQVGNFQIEAEHNDDETFTWKSSVTEKPFTLMVHPIGKRIEEFFGL